MNQVQGYPHRRRRWGVWQGGVGGGGGGMGWGGGSDGYCRVRISEWEKGVCEGGAVGCVAKVVGPGKGGAVLVHVGTNDVNKNGSYEVMGRYRELVRELKRVWVGQIVLSSVRDSTGEGWVCQEHRRTSINLKLQALCQEEGGGLLNMWEHFEQGDQLFSKDGLHLNKRGAAVLGKGFLRALENFLKTRTEWGG